MAIQERTGSSSATEIELLIHDEECFFVGASDRAACRLSLEHLAHRSGTELLEFFAVEGAQPGRIVELSRETTAVGEARVVRQDPGGGLVELLVDGSCVTTTLADTGAVTRAVTASEGTGRVVASVPAHADVRTVVETFRTRHGGTELVARRQAPESIPVRSEQGVRGTMTDRLTDKQIEVLRTAYLQGYFEWPRESSAKECAQSLGISQPTFSQHMRAIQDAMAECLFEDTQWGDRPLAGDRGGADPTTASNTDRQ